MKKYFLSSYYLFVSAGLLFLIFCGGTAIFSHFFINKKKELNNLFLEKINYINSETGTIKKEIINTEALNSNNIKDDLTKNTNAVFLYSLEKNSTPNSLSFEEEIQSDLLKFKKQSFIKKIALPSNFFETLKQNIFCSKNTEKNSQYKEKQWFLFKKVLEIIFSFSKLNIDQFEIKNDSNSSCENNDQIISFGTLIIKATMTEDVFRKLLNEIISSENGSIISSISILNSVPNPPLHHYFLSKENLIQILGNEKITAILKINLFNIKFYSSSLSNSLLPIGKNSAFLFISKPYAIHDEELISLIKYPITLCPPVPNEWLLDYHLNYSDPNILFEDPDQTGFTNLEKWQGDNPKEEPGKFPSDPNDPSSHPLLWTKLKCYQKDIKSEVSKVCFLGCETINQEKIFQIQPITPLARKNYQGHTTFDKQIQYVKIGEKIEGIPYKVIGYQEKKSVYKNTDYDSSELTIENLDTKKPIPLIKKTPYHTKAYNLITIASIKLENTLFNPPDILSLKIGDYFSLNYVLPNNGALDNQNIIETENYHLIDFENNQLILEKDSIKYKVPIIPTAK